MRRVQEALTLLLAVVAAGPLQAGVYSLAQARAFAGRGSEDKDVRQQLKELSPNIILGDVGALRSMNDAAPTAKELSKSTADRRALLKKVEELEARQKERPLPTADVVTLSAYYIRRGRADLARKLLDEELGRIPADDPYRFLLLLNRAAANESEPELLRRAIEDQSAALEAWPKEFKGWSADDLSWYRVAERYFLAYLQARDIDVQRNPAAAGTVQAVAPLFPKARFDVPGREYRAGSLWPETADALPLDALEVTTQMLLWLPNDSRLYWLYGELLNGKGALVEAKGIFNDLYENRFVRAVKSHREAIDQAVENMPKATESAPPPPPPSGPPTLTAPDLRQIGTGFVVGVVLTALALFQWRLWRTATG
jgi:hypothetical protein